MPLHKPKRLGFFAMLLALLGIGGCGEMNSDPEGLNNMCMYGTPTAHYSVKGQVTDADGSPIPDINVSFFGIYYGSPGTRAGVDPFRVNLKTDSKGAYEWDSAHFPYPQVRVQFDDTDGPANGGEFESTNTLVNVTFVKDKKDTNVWNSGNANINVPTIKLKKK